MILLVMKTMFQMPLIAKTFFFLPQLCHSQKWDYLNGGGEKEKGKEKKKKKRRL